MCFWNKQSTWNQDPPLNMSSLHIFLSQPAHVFDNANLRALSIPLAKPGIWPSSLYPPLWWIYISCWRLLQSSSLSFPHVSILDWSLVAISNEVTSSGVMLVIYDAVDNYIKNHLKLLLLHKDVHVNNNVNKPCNLLVINSFQTNWYNDQKL